MVISLAGIIGGLEFVGDEATGQSILLPNFIFLHKWMHELKDIFTNLAISLDDDGLRMLAASHLRINLFLKCVGAVVGIH